MLNARKQPRWGPSGLLLVFAVAAGLFGATFAAPSLRAQEEKKDDGGPPPSPGSGVDTVLILGKDGKASPRKGEIVEETAAKIMLKTADGVKPFKREEIQRVEYGGEPMGFRQAEILMNKNDPEAAAKAYKAVADECDAGKQRAIFKPRAFVLQGRALVAAGNFSDAGQAFEAAIKANPKGPLLRDATREGVRAYIRGNNAAKASAIATEAKKSFSEAELPEVAQDEAQLLLAEAYEASGKAAEARSAYNLLTNSRDPQVKGRASLGAARSALISNDVARAASQFKNILSDDKVERSVRCGAARGLGDAIMKQPGIAKDYAKLREAAKAYADALAVHFPARGEPSEDREAALHEGAKVYDLLAEVSGSDKDGKAREAFTTNARQLREELLRLYKTSPFAKENEQKLLKAPEPAGADAPGKG